MSIVLAIVQFLVNEILSVPAFLIGIITAIGLAAMRKGVGQVVGGAIKAVLGFLLIGAGAGLVVNSLNPLGTMIEGALGAHGVVPTNEAIAGIAQQQYGSQVAWIMLAGFLVSLVLARVTPLRYVFLTGHHMLFMATLITIVMASASMPTPIVIGLGSLLLGTLMVSLPALAHPFTRKVTGGENIAIGHFGTSGYIASAATGRLVDPHGRSRSTEEIKVPKGLRFLRDSMVATALSMVLMYVIMAIVFLARRGRTVAFTAFPDGATGIGNYIMSSVTQPATSPTWATVARCAVSGQRIDTTCSGERSGVTPAARCHNPRSCLEGGLGAPAGRGIRLRDEGTGAFSPPGAVMLSPVLVTAPSPAAPRAGAGSHPLSTTFFCTAMADSRMMTPIRVRMTAPGTTPAREPQPMRMPNHPKSASPKVVFADPKDPSTLSRKAGRNVTSKPLTKAPAMAPRRPPVALP